jgi:hypothetical protein
MSLPEPLVTPKPKVGDTFYRYEDRRYAPMLDEFDNPAGPGRVAVDLQIYCVTKITPCGVWLGDRFVNQQRVKQFAHSTKEAAHAAFLARKARQASILQKQLSDVKRAIALANALVVGESHSDCSDYIEIVTTSG